MDQVYKRITNKADKEIKLIKLSTIVNFCFGLTGIFFAIITNSRSILFDGLYSFVLSFFTLMSTRVVRLITKGQTVKYQFGYGAYEPLLIIVRSIFLFGMYAILGYEAIISLFRGGYQISAPFALVYSVISTLACAIIWVILRKTARRNISPVLKAESYSWFLDTILSFAVLLAFMFIYLLTACDCHQLVPYVDPMITLVLVFLMLPSLYQVFLSNFRDLVSAAPSEKIQDELRSIMNEFQEKYSFVNIENFSEKRGRSLYLISHVYLDKEIPIKTLDKIRKEMVRTIKRWWFYSDIDIVFTLNPSWIELSNINSNIDYQESEQSNK